MSRDLIESPHKTRQNLEGKGPAESIRATSRCRCFTRPDSRRTNLFHGVHVIDTPIPQQGRGLRQVGGDDCGQGEEVGLQGLDNLGGSKGVSTGGYQHWVHHQGRHLVPLHLLGHCLHCLRQCGSSKGKLEGVWGGWGLGWGR